jgi:hypothetical protein
MDEYNLDTTGDSGSGAGYSDVLSSLFASAASVVNTNTIANANPVNAAILTNTPIATPTLSTGYAGATVPSGGWFLFGALILGGILLVANKR